MRDPLRPESRIASREALLADLPRVSVGPTVLQGHPCITLVHNELDLQEAG